MASILNPSHNLSIRRAHILLMVAMFAGLNLALLGDWPIWISAINLVAVIVFTAIHTGKMTPPSKLLRTILAVAALALALTSGADSWVEGLLRFLGIAVSAKLLEVRNWRDISSLALLVVFLLASSLIFHQSMGQALLVLFDVLLLFWWLLSLHRQTVSVRADSRTLAVWVVQGLPIFLLLFLLMPRISSIWQMNRTVVGTTGLSEEVAPGEIGQLVQNDSLAFRVEFSGERPAQSQLYWRVMTHESFDGYSWRIDASRKLEVQQLMRRQKQSFAVQAQGPALDYAVITEPSSRAWLYVLDVASRTSANELLTSDYRMFSRRPLNQSTRVNVVSYPQAELSELSEQHRQINLMVPPGLFPRLSEWALTQRQEVATDEEYVQRVLAEFRQSPFRYTLKPPVLGDAGIEQFFFQTQAGFCEHYASAFTYLMRVAGIPARVVTGYQGGEYNPAGNYMSIYQFDAHAWSEIWLEDKGWVRFDPTAAVAPERVELNLISALQNQGDFLSDAWFSLHQYPDLAWLQQLRYNLSSLDYYWTVWVLGYDGQTQLKYLKQYIQDADLKTLGQLVMLFLALTLAVMYWLVVKGKTPQNKPAWQLLYHDKILLWQQLGLSKLPSTTASEFSLLVAEFRPSLADLWQEFTDTYVQLCYRPLSGEEAKLRQKEMHRLARQLRKEMKKCK